MAVLPIRKYGDEVLRTPAQPVVDYGESLQRLIEDMIETMYAAPGVGLAANQVGVSLRLMMIDLSVGKTPGELHICINPEIIERSGEYLDEEGCLSIPDLSELVSRPDHCTIRFLDRNREERTLSGEGLMARAMCHEIDHLNGGLFVDHLRGFRRDRLLKKIQRITAAGMWD